MHEFNQGLNCAEHSGFHLALDSTDHCAAEQLDKLMVSLRRRLRKDIKC